MVLLSIVSFLEKSANGLTAKEIDIKLDDTGVNTISLRTLQRRLKELAEAGFQIGCSKNKYFIEPQSGYLESVLRLIRSISLNPRYMPYIYGDTDIRALCGSLQALERPATTLYTILQALCGGYEIEFRYQPQTMQTRAKLLKLPATAGSIIVLPHFLVFSQESGLILGENFKIAPLTKIKLGKPRIRQYELKGVSNIKKGAQRAPSLQIDPNTIYKNSMRVWIGGREHDIKLEEIDVSGKKISTLRRKIYGEDELLGYLVSKMGRVKVIEPPPALVALAREKEFPLHLIFHFPTKKTCPRRQNG